VIRTRLSCAAVFVYLVGVALPATAQVDDARAQAYFKEAQALCERDGGRLWGVPLCAPMIVGDLRTQTFATSRPAPDAPRPRLVGLVNSPIQWGGVTWGAYMWDFLVNSTPQARNELVLHELFHGVQPQLGLGVENPASEHLDTPEGRFWLRLEWRALAQALRATGQARTDAVADALAFRQARRMLFPGSDDNERRSEIAEGLAAYTGTVLATPDPAGARARTIELLAGGESGESFVRTFAYMSGPAYGLLLDASSPGWPRRIRRTDDLAALVANALSVQPAADASASAARYGGTELLASERLREQQRQARVAELRQRFVDGPVLVIRGGGSGMFDSRDAVAIAGSGTVFFKEFRYSGAPGVLEARNGVLVASDGGSRQVAAPVREADGTFSGDGWTFKAAPGWIVREGPRRGDYEVVQDK
jgi:hypothetical protein